MFIEELIPGINLENKNVEFKGIIEEGKNDKGKLKELGWLKTLAAYANTDGGKLYIGVEDKSHKLVSLDHTTCDQVIRLIHRQIRSRVEPVIDYVINAISIGDGIPARFVLEVTVKASKYLPVVIHEDGLLGIYVRNFGETNIASPERIREMILASDNVAYDKAFTDVKYKEADFSALAAYVRKYGHELTVKELISIGFVSSGGMLSRGALLFMDDCRDVRTQISCCQWPGIDKGSAIVIANNEYVGNLLDLIKSAVDFVINHSANGFIKTETSRDAYIAYPVRSITEGIVNAIAHRNYFIQGAQIEVNVFKDRLEITSPGALLGVKNLVKERNISSIIPRRRNEVICQTLVMCHYMESKGSGFDKIENDYASYQDNFKPYISSDSSSFTLVLPDLTYSGVIEQGKQCPEVYAEGLLSGKYDLNILSFCYSKERPVAEIAEYIGVKPSTYFRKNVLGKLVKMGYLHLFTNEKMMMLKSNRDMVKLK